MKWTNTINSGEYIYAINTLNAESMIGGKRRIYATLGYARAALKNMRIPPGQELLIIRYRFDGFEEAENEIQNR